jgi:hypothetical protein
MPTTDEDEEVVNKWFEDMSELIKKLNGEGNLFMLGEWNLIVEEGAEGNNSWRELDVTEECNRRNTERILFTA